jgi:hypothetical protein
MSGFLITVLCLASYGGGLFLLRRVTPMLLKSRYDDVFFMGMAAAVIIGSLLAFAPIAVLFAYFNNSLTVRIFDVILLSGIAVIAIGTAFRCFRPVYSTQVVRLSGILAGSYYILVLVLAAYALILMFVQ